MVKVRRPGAARRAIRKGSKPGLARRSGRCSPAPSASAARPSPATSSLSRRCRASRATGKSISGASPRATIALIEGARALAFLRGRPYALPQDLIDLVPDVLRHRLVLTYEALSDGMTADALILKILQAVPAPDKPLDRHVQLSAQKAN